MKDGIRQIVGKTISGVLVADVANSPRRQVFLTFDDETHFELWGREISGTGGVDPGGFEKVRTNVEIAGSKIVMEAAPKAGLVATEATPPPDRQARSHYGLLIVGGIAVAMMAFAAGRAYPIHSYRQLSGSSYLYDGRTGKACAPFRSAEQQAKAINAGNGKDEYAGVNSALPKRTVDMIPACGSE
jgi:hypothetical protein